MTAAASAAALGVAQSIGVQFAAFQGLLLTASASHKWIGRERALSAIQNFGRVPRRAAPWVLAAVSLAELAAGLLLWVPSHRAQGAMLAAMIWGGYLSLILRAMAQGRRNVDCGCSFGGAHQALGAFQVVRNTALAVMALMVAALSEAYGTGAITATQVLPAFALLALYAAMDQVMALAPMRSGELL